jgi:UDP-N-acetylglucosamine--N-acetylmuramyl-(pentapeptide) pyrophosphoryl-undecaprenol N-acetylglucosamine transferase
MPTIIFTGGGTAGHVTPNIALIKKFQKEGWNINYIGSKNGIEKELIAPLEIPFFAIANGKLRRYFSWQNFIDPCKIIVGIVQAFFLCRKIKPNVVFSKGGFVTFPVVVAAFLNKIPVIIHESDLTPGLANRLGFCFANKICVTFPDTVKYLPDKTKAAVTGNPIREEFFSGSKEKGLEICGFSQPLGNEKNKKVILVFGGSLGAECINTAIRKLLPDIFEKFQIIHVCGKGKIDSNYNYAGYKQFEYLHEEFPHIMAAADLVISRSGANTVYELLMLRKPHIFIPLSKKYSRGDQIDNANYFANLGFSQIVFEEDLADEKSQKLLEKILWVNEHCGEISSKLNTFTHKDGVSEIYDIAMSFFK